MLPACSMIGSLVFICRRMLRALRIGERGLRSSWDSKAMNSSLLRLASARPSARFRWASVAWLSVRSCITRAKDRACLFSSSRGVTVAWHQNRVPSLRTCQRTLSARPSAEAVLSSCSGWPLRMSSGEKKREKCCPMISSDLVAEQAFRPGVPAEQMPARLDQEDGVLLRFRRQQVESLSHFLRRERAVVVLGHGFTFLRTRAETSVWLNFDTRYASSGYPSKPTFPMQRRPRA